MESQEQILYLNNRYHWRDWFDPLLEKVLGMGLTIQTDNTQRIIPKTGPLVFAFIPHGGWVEPIAIDQTILKIRSKTPVWLTKIENGKELPGFMASRRHFLFMDRDYPQPSVIKKVCKILNVQGSIASALEGTRRGNPQNPNDLRYLGEAHPGLMWLAEMGKAPVIPVVVIGSENYLPLLEAEKEKRGIAGIAVEIIRRGLIDRTLVQVRFLPPYKAHLEENHNSMSRTDWSKMHTDIMVRDCLITEIMKLDPAFPLGFYART